MTTIRCMLLDDEPPVTREKTIAPKENLHLLEERLPPDKFLRVHRSFVVNLDHIQYLEGNHLSIEVTKIPVGQLFRKRLLERLSR